MHSASCSSRRDCLDIAVAASAPRWLRAPAPQEGELRHPPELGRDPNAHGAGSVTNFPEAWLRYYREVGDNEVQCAACEEENDETETSSRVAAGCASLSSSRPCYTLGR
jgi:hypothetical protein